MVDELLWTNHNVKIFILSYTKYTCYVGARITAVKGVNDLEKTPLIANSVSVKYIGVENSACC